MQIARDIAGFSPAEGGHAAQGDRQEEARPDGDAEGRTSSRAAAASGTSTAVAKQLWSLMDAAADYSFNKSHAACYGADRLPHRVPEGELPGRVHGRADLER